jgi:hypothetical protein
LEHSNQSAEFAQTYELPGLNSWFYLDERGGTEVFYLIVSKKPLQELETSTGRYLEGRAAARKILRAIPSKHDVLDEIRRIIKESSFLSDDAEKPIAVAGDFRGIREEHELNGVRIEAVEIYVRTIRLQH